MAGTLICPEFSRFGTVLPDQTVQLKRAVGTGRRMYDLGQTTGSGQSVEGNVGQWGVRYNMGRKDSSRTVRAKRITLLTIIIAMCKNIKDRRRKNGASCIWQCDVIPSLEPIQCLNNGHGHGHFDGLPVFFSSMTSSTLVNAIHTQNW